VIVPNSNVWGQPLRNFSIYPTPPYAAQVRFKISEDTELDPTIEKMRSLIKADPRVLADPAPSVLLDRSAAENALEVVVAFAAGEDVAPVVKSDLIKAAHAVLDPDPTKPIAHSV
jgi:small conductance mechanosensitive channel